MSQHWACYQARGLRADLIALLAGALAALALPPLHVLPVCWWRFPFCSR